MTRSYSQPKCGFVMFYKDHVRFPSPFPLLQQSDAPLRHKETPCRNIVETWRSELRTLKRLRTLVHWLHLERLHSAAFHQALLSLSLFLSSARNPKRTRALSPIYRPRPQNPIPPDLRRRSGRGGSGRCERPSPGRTSLRSLRSPGRSAARESGKGSKYK